MKARAHTLVILSFHSQMHYQRGLFPPARSELHSSGGHTSSNLPTFKVQRGRQAWPPAGSLGSIFISFQGMSVNLESCTDKKIFTMPTEGYRHIALLSFVLFRSRKRNLNVNEGLCYPIRKFTPCNIW